LCAWHEEAAVELMTSGEFARASGLSRKALRLYDELDLLRPAEIDSGSGYRRYAPSQLEQARLVAWLRRLGMPLAAIRQASTAAPAQAAAILTAYWDQVEAETTARRALAAFLIGYLSGKETAVNDAQATLAIRYAVRTDIGLKREENEDTAYAGAQLLAIADGMGGHAAGEVASAAVIDALKPLDTQVPAGEVLNALDHAVRQASRRLTTMAKSDPALRGMGTTLTALLWSGSELGLVHIGDSRAYLSHPQRNLILRALVADGGCEPDLSLREAVPGDRYLLCSDGLHEVVNAAAIARVLLTVADPDEAASGLVELALAGGGPDNVTCIVADVVAAAVPVA
jgi:serine/threonine protein phosphatase PrpC